MKRLLAFWCGDTCRWIGFLLSDLPMFLLIASIFWVVELFDIPVTENADLEEIVFTLTMIVVAVACLWNIRIRLLVSWEAWKEQVRSPQPYDDQRGHRGRVRASLTRTVVAVLFLLLGVSALYTPPPGSPEIRRMQQVGRLLLLMSVAFIAWDGVNAERDRRYQVEQYRTFQQRQRKERNSVMTDQQNRPALAPETQIEPLAAQGGTPTPLANPTPPMALDPQSAWQLRWQALLPDAEYHADWGIEQAWKAHAAEWGYPMQLQEARYTYNGADVGGRVFTLVGLIVWLPSEGAHIVGWPA